VAAARTEGFHAVNKMWPNDLIAMVAVTLFAAILLVTALLLVRGF
jgi:hypothetical protein